MEFSSIVLMEVDKSKQFVKELGSYEVGEGSENIIKLFYDGEKINIYFDTNKEVEDWEFTAIYDHFNEDEFIKNGFQIEPYDEEFNPTWIVRFDFNDEYEVIKQKINKICSLIHSNMKSVFEIIKDKEFEYK